MWFKNRRAKWRKRERNAMNAAVAAADFKSGFGTQFMQPFADDSLYSSYTYNNWTKVPSPLGTKPFPWPVNPLGSMVTTNHHQNSVNCFNTGASGVAVSMNNSMLPGTMGSTLTNSNVGAAPCPYTAPANPYMYRAAAEPCMTSSMSSSIATLRLKAKQHTTGFASPYSAPSPVSRSNSAGLSACQYTGVTDVVWENALGALLNQHQHHLHHFSGGGGGGGGSSSSSSNSGNLNTNLHNFHNNNNHVLLNNNLLMNHHDNATDAKSPHNSHQHVDIGDGANGSNGLIGSNGNTEGGEDNDEDVID